MLETIFPLNLVMQTVQKPRSDLDKCRMRQDQGRPPQAGVRRPLLNGRTQRSARLFLFSTLTSIPLQCVVVNGPAALHCQRVSLCSAHALHRQQSRQPP